MEISHCFSMKFGNYIILDPFMGSGTTAIVAKKLDRRFCGVEMNLEYCCWAEKRLMLTKHDSSIQGYVDGLFWERNSLNEQSKKKETSIMATQGALP